MRKSMSRSASRRKFSKASGVKSVNYKPQALGRRGGIRL